MGWLQTLDAAIGAACRGVLYLTLAVVFTILSVNVGLRYVAGTSLASASATRVPASPAATCEGVSQRR